MGVHSLWDIVSPIAKPVRLESLNERKMAVDASIWMYQFLKAMRNKEGDALRNAHIVGFFRRICKLLYYGIKPVFVFDGGVPVLKLNTIRERKERRQGKRDDANATARKLLARQIHQMQAGNGSPSKKGINTETSPSGLVQGAEGIISAGDNADPGSRFYPHDEYHLPEIKGFKYEEDDLRITDSEDYKTVMDQIDDLDGIDLDSINPASKEFEELPKSTQYLVLSALRLKSRLRLGYTKEQLEQVFPDSMDFSKFQIEMVKRRNFFTQKLMNVTGLHDGGASKLTEDIAHRVSGQRDRKYALVRSGNGWALSLKGNDGSEVTKAIKIDEDDKVEEQGNGDALEWEDVDTKPKPKKKELDYSINASFLPRLAASSSEGGSRSFLDKRPDLVPTTSHLLDDDADEEDDYQGLLRETTAMREYRRSVAEKTSSINVLQAEKSPITSLDNESSDEEIDDVAFEEVHLTTSKPTQSDRSEIPTSLQNKKSSIPTLNNRHSHELLNSIVEKIPDLPFKINAHGRAFEDSSNTRSSERNLSDPLIDIEESVAKEKPTQEVPAWFSSATNTNPFAATSFVVDKERDEPRPEESYGLLTGEAAQELVRERARLNQEVVELEGEEEEESDDDIVEINEKAKETVRDTTEPNDAINASLTAHNISTKSHGAQSSFESDADEPSSDVITGEQLPLLDYDFYEDEEKHLAEQLDREQQDYNKFRTTLNPNLINTAFLEDEIFEQQKKDKRDSDEVTVDMIHEVQSLLSRFGIPYITAPMEAEAQCATLLQLKLVDGIITDDSDVFLFGGTHVYKNMFQEKNYVEYYNLELLDHNLGLDRDKLIQLAQLLGSDYTPGLKGIGPVLGVEILAEFGSLLNFKTWYNEGQFDKSKLEAENSFQKRLRKRMITNEIVLDDAFPSGAVHDAYMHPTVDSDETKFVWGSPDLDKLRVFLQQTIGWDKQKSDEVLVPLIKDLNNRKSAGVQKRINEFFPVQYLQQDKQYKLGKRIETATSKLKKRRIK